MLVSKVLFCSTLGRQSHFLFSIQCLCSPQMASLNSYHSITLIPSHYSASISVLISASSDDSWSLTSSKYTMKTSRYRQRRQGLYVLPGHCVVLTQLHAQTVYIHTPALLQSINNWSVAGLQNVINGSCEPVTDTCWGPAMTVGPLKKNLIITKSHTVSESETGRPVPHTSSLRTLLCPCTSERANCWKTNGHPFFFFYLSVPLLKFRGAAPPVTG